MSSKPQNQLTQKDPGFVEYPGEGYEFPVGADHPPSSIERREMLKLMGVTAMLSGGLAGCIRKPRRKIVSQVTMPEYRKPGIPLYYASTWMEGSYPYGMLVKTVDGRPIKIEGNPQHPINGESSNAQMQASIYTLYDPERLGAPVGGEKEVSWEEADQSIVEHLRTANSIALITGSNIGSSEQSLIGELKKLKPGLKHLVHESVHNREQRLAWQKVYGSDGEVLPQFNKAKVIVSIESDFLATDGVSIESNISYSDCRELNPEHPEQSRLWVVEGGFTTTGANADHRIRLRPSKAIQLVDTILASVKGNASAEIDGVDSKLLNAMASDLSGHKGEALVVAGPQMPEAVHVKVAELNSLLEAEGKTLLWNPAPLPMANSTSDISTAFQDGVDVAIIMGANPAYDFNGDFATLLKSAKVTIGHGLYENETVAACQIKLPSKHNLESWNDSEVRPGLYGLCQPTVDLADLFDARQEAESLLRWGKALAKENHAVFSLCEDYHDYIKLQWSANQYKAADAVDKFDLFWEGCLRDGLLNRAETLSGPKFTAAQVTSAETNAGAVDIIVRPHSRQYDGRWGNVSWLHENPDSITKVVWDNFALVGKSTAEKLGVARPESTKVSDLLTVKVGDQTVTLPVYVQPGVADDTIQLTLGHGRTNAMQAEGGGTIGQNVSRLINGDSAISSYVAGASASKGKSADGASSHRLVSTQEAQHLIDEEYGKESEERPLILRANLGDYKDNPEFVKDRRHIPTSPHQVHNTYEDEFNREDNYKWGMVIDLNKCTGCGDCTVACQAENNIPVVGKDQVQRGRELHWIRVDRYFSYLKEVTKDKDGHEVVGEVVDPDNPDINYQPLPCQHCEKAPCETVCPVAATTHSHEGLNEMTYNRCVGTRYCANNCPYKVRRFNYYEFSRLDLENGVDTKAKHNPRTMAYNPQVTVRGVGVMEKCTYCVQRISAAKYTAKENNLNGAKKAAIGDNDLKTACQQACSAKAIVFGDFNNKETTAYKWINDSREYSLLEELNNAPRTRYMAKVYNPHPDLPKKRQGVTLEHHEEGGDHSEHAGDDHNKEEVKKDSH